MSTFQNGGITYNKLVYTLNSTNYTFIGTINIHTDGNGTYDSSNPSNTGTNLSPPTTDPTLVIPSTDGTNTVIGIMAGAFRNCTNLQKLVLPDTIRYIGVTSVNNGVVTIDQTSSAKGSFEGCTGLVHIKLSENSLFTHIPPNSFSPVPKVWSSLILLSPKSNFEKLKKDRNLEHITNIFFHQRRKMIKRPMKFLFKDYIDISNKLNIDLKLRPQNLSVRKYIEICKIYEDLNI